MSWLFYTAVIFQKKSVVITYFGPVWKGNRNKQKPCSHFLYKGRGIVFSPLYLKERDWYLWRHHDSQKRILRLPHGRYWEHSSLFQILRNVQNKSVNLLLLKATSWVSALEVCLLLVFFLLSPNLQNSNRHSLTHVKVGSTLRFISEWNMVSHIIDVLLCVYTFG